MEDPNAQRQAEASGWSVHTIQLDYLPVGIHRLLQTICLCLWTHCLGKHDRFFMYVYVYTLVCCKYLSRHEVGL